MLEPGHHANHGQQFSFGGAVLPLSMTESFGGNGYGKLHPILNWTEGTTHAICTGVNVQNKSVILSRMGEHLAIEQYLSKSLKGLPLPFTALSNGVHP